MPPKFPKKDLRNVSFTVIKNFTGKWHIYMGGKKTDAEVKHKNSVYDYVNSLLLIFLLPKIICRL